MRPILFEIGPFPIYAYGFMMLLAFVASMKIGAARFRSKGIKPEYIYDIGLVAMLSGILGARIFYITQYNARFDWKLFDFSDGLSFWGLIIGAVVFVACYRCSQAFFYLAVTTIALIIAHYKGLVQVKPGHFHLITLAFPAVAFFFLYQNYQDAWQDIKTSSRRKQILVATSAIVFMIISMRFFYCFQRGSEYSWGVFMIWRGGLVFYGGFLLGTGTMLYFLKKENLPVLKVCDVLAPCVALGLAFVRIGCFCNGCCYGGFCPENSPIGVHYPSNSLVGEKNVRGINPEPLWQQYDRGNYLNWLFHPLFSLEQEQQNDLNKGEISDALRQSFHKQKHSLSPFAEITYKKENRNWQIRDSAHKTDYTIKKVPIFKDYADYSRELKAGKISNSLRFRFKDYKLSQKAKVTGISPGLWTISDGNKIFYVNQQKAGTPFVSVYSLNVYSSLYWSRSLLNAIPKKLYYKIYKPVYPSQLISSITGFFLFLFLTWFYRFRKYDGDMILMFGIVYGIARFSLEIVRHDTPGVMSTGLTAGQATSYMLFSVCAGIFIFLRLRPHLPWNKVKGDADQLSPSER